MSSSPMTSSSVESTEIDSERQNVSHHFQKNQEIRDLRLVIWRSIYSQRILDKSDFFVRSRIHESYQQYHIEVHSGEKGNRDGRCFFIRGHWFHNMIFFDFLKYTYAKHLYSDWSHGFYTFVISSYKHEISRIWTDCNSYITNILDLCFMESSKTSRSMVNIYYNNCHYVYSNLWSHKLLVSKYPSFLIFHS